MAKKKYKTRHNSAKGVVLDVGVKRGRLTIIKEVEPAYDSRHKTIHRYLCKCDCGNEVVKTDDTLMRGLIPSCGCAHKKIINEGDKIGSFTIIRQLTRGKRTYLCKCECGHECVKGIDSLKSANPICDGPNHKIMRLYIVFRNMVNRCNNPKNISYRNYGGRGIKVCDEWQNNYYLFQKWALANGYDPEALQGETTIDRIDVNGNYCPENCRWVDMRTQGFNKRTNHLLTYNGETHPLKEWAEIAGVPFERVFSRINKYEWPVGEALEFEPHTPRSKKSSKPRKKGYEKPSMWKAIMVFKIDGSFVGEFGCAKKASEATGVSLDNVYRCCCGTYKKTHGYIFKYKENCND